MVLKYSFNELFRGKFPIPKKLYEVLEDIDKGVQPKVTVKKDVKLTNEDLIKAFGKRFNSIGVVHNSEGSYLIIANKGNFNYIGLEKV